MNQPLTAAVRFLSGEREPVRVATTGNLPSLVGLLTIDGISLSVGDRVLVKDQTDAVKNGIWLASEGDWFRASDAGHSRAINKGVTVTVREGTVNSGRDYRFTASDPVVGTDNISVAWSGPQAAQDAAEAAQAAAEEAEDGAIAARDAAIAALDGKYDKTGGVLTGDTDVLKDTPIASLSGVGDSYAIRRFRNTSGTWDILLGSDGELILRSFNAGGVLQGNHLTLENNGDITFADRPVLGFGGSGFATLADVAGIASPGVRLSTYCDGDGSLEDVGFNAFLAALTAGGRYLDGIIDIPVRLSSSKTLTGYMGTLRGVNDGRLIFTGGTDGLIIDNSAVASGYLNTFCSDGLVILTESDGLGVAFRYKASTVAGDLLVPSVDIDGLSIRGIDQYKGWQKGAVFDRVMQSRISNATVRGRTTGLDAGCMESGFEFVNGCNMVDIYSLKAEWGLTGILVANVGSFSEGIRLYGGHIRAMRRGMETAAPGEYHQAKGVHFDTTQNGVIFGADGVSGSDYSSVEDCFFLRSDAEGFDFTYISVLLRNQGSVVANNRITLNGDLDGGGVSRQHDSYGVIGGSYADTSKQARAAITGNRIEGPIYPIHLRPSTKQCNVKGNSIDALGNASMTAGGILNDGGANNSVTGNISTNSAGVITIT